MEKTIDTLNKFKSLIIDGKSINDIMDIYNISEYDIFDALLSNEDEFDFFMEKEIKKYYNNFYIKDDKALIISDSHIGNKYENIKYLYTAYSFAYKKNIKNVIHLGDIVEGYCHMDDVKYDADKQIINTIDFFGSINDITTYYLMGNHDYNLKKFDNIDLKNELMMIDNLKYMGISNSYFHLNSDDFIKVLHKTKTFDGNYLDIPSSVYLEGHYHRYYKKKNNILCPALIDGTDPLYRPGFLYLENIGDSYILKYYSIFSHNAYTELDNKILKKRF